MISLYVCLRKVRLYVVGSSWKDICKGNVEPLQSKNLDFKIVYQCAGLFNNIFTFKDDCVKHKI